MWAPLGADTVSTEQWYEYPFTSDGHVQEHTMFSEFNHFSEEMNNCLKSLPKRASIKMVLSGVKEVFDLQLFFESRFSIHFPRTFFFYLLVFQ